MSLNHQGMLVWFPINFRGFCNGFGSEESLPLMERSPVPVAAGENVRNFARRLASSNYIQYLFRSWPVASLLLYHSAPPTTSTLVQYTSALPHVQTVTSTL